MSSRDPTPSNGLSDEQDPILKELVTMIKESHKNPDHNLQQLTLQKTIEYIGAHADQRHLFCDKSMYHPSIHALTLFSFPENDALTWYKRMIAHSLDTCSKCFTLFHRGRAKLKTTFAIERGVNASNVQQFITIILTWEAERLFPKLQNSFNEYKKARGRVSSTAVPREVLMGFAECLCAPGMLRVNNELKTLFDNILYSLLAMDHKFISTATRLTPGYIYLLFDGDAVQKKWAHKMFESLYASNPSEGLTSVSSDILEEYEVHFLNIQSPSFVSDETIELFFRNIFLILRLYNGEVILDKFSIPQDIESIQKVLTYSIFPLVRFLQSKLMGPYVEPRPYMLRVLAMILKKVGDKFWNQTSNYTFHNYIESICASPTFASCMELLKIEEEQTDCDPDASVDDMISWIDPFNDTLTGSEKQQSYNRISLSLISHMESQNNIPLDNRAVMFEEACKLMTKALTLKSKLYSPSFTTDLLLRSDSRVVVDQKLIRFVDYATCKAIFFPPFEKSKNSAIAIIAIEVLCKALRFDLLSFVQNSYDIHSGKKPSTLKFSPHLFQTLLKQNFSVQLELAFQLLSSMENVSGIINLPGPHKLEVEQLIKFLVQFFVNFSDIDVKNTKMILSNPTSLNGYWSCVFSANSDIYQSAVDILYEAFDASGRLEGLHGLLSNNLDSCIRAINRNLTNLIFIKFYEPSPRAVKVLSDVVHSLNNKINGIFSNKESFNDSTKEALIFFWNRCWNFLDLIYVETLTWANKYPDQDLIEFTRDTLDLSHAVLQCFDTINKISPHGDVEKTFYEITKTFPHMLVWLRLSDPGLLASCVKLISSTVDLATKLDLKLDSNVIELLAKYGSRAKKFNNKLTDQQSAEIIARARIFDKELVDNTILESERYKKSKEVIESSVSATSSRDSTPVASDGYKRPTESTTAVPRARGQMKITNFGSLSKTPSTAPAKPQIPLSAMEKARLEMKAKAKPARVIHEPRPAGFNVRDQDKRRAKESSDEDSDNEDAHSLFNLPKPKKEGIIILGESKSLSKPRRSAAEERKREEEYSRLRLNVNMKPLYQEILKWSYQTESDYPNGEELNYPVIPDKFKTAEDYIKRYEPLLFLECWQAILTAKRREADKPIPISVASKSTVDNFFEVFFNLTKTEINEKGISESDLVVLALYDQPGREPSISDVKKSKLTCFAKVNEIKYVKGDSADISLRVIRSAALNTMLTPHSPIIMTKVMQMTTIEREYSSLHGLKYYNLSPEILQATPDATPELSPNQVAEVKQTYKVNDSQARAIAASVKSSGFFLIQGPPGTGKTKTILGIIAHMLSSFRASNAIAMPSAQALEKTGSVSSFKNKKVLVCAPSNAAVDELVLRLKGGILNAKGENYSPKLVRLGRSDAINSAVKDMTLEELVDAQLGKNNPSNPNNMSALFKELAEVRKELDLCRVKIADENPPSDHEVYAKRREYKLKTNEIKKKLDQERESQNSAYRSREINRRNIQAKILGEAEIICSTLSGAAHDMVANIGIKFDSVIIDEACQCTELSAIIPLRYGCKRCIMVGDPNQLPPTVLSSVAADSKYDQSLFVRMAKNVKPLLLNVQYRMHSDISQFPSKKFYNGELKDGPTMDKLTARPWHQNELFPTYKFCDIVEGQESQNSKTFSYINRVEIDIAMEIIEKLFQTYQNMDFTNKIGVITPYKEQNRSLQQAFVRKFGNAIKKEITFNTIDGFQGQEKEIIIMSCVRADANKSGVGFLRDYRRMNVALTRSKSSLWILGNHNSLVKNSLWSDLISNAKERGKFGTVRRGFTSSSRSKTYNDSSTQKSEKIENQGNSNAGSSKGTSVVSSHNAVVKDKVNVDKIRSTQTEQKKEEPISLVDTKQVPKHIPVKPDVPNGTGTFHPVKPIEKKSSVFKPAVQRNNNPRPPPSTNELPLPSSTNNSLPRRPSGPNNSRPQGKGQKRPNSSGSSIFLKRKNRRF